MINFIRNKTPFILLGFSLLFSICSYFEWYFIAFKYLGDLIGYSLFTNIFMFFYYNRKAFCTSTKIAVLGLISLNIFNLLYLYLDINGGLYDLLIIAITFFVLIYLKIK